MQISGSFHDAGPIRSAGHRRRFRAGLLVPYLVSHQRSHSIDRRGRISAHSGSSWRFQGTEK